VLEAFQGVLLQPAAFLSLHLPPTLDALVPPTFTRQACPHPLAAPSRQSCPWPGNACQPRSRLPGFWQICLLQQPCYLSLAACFA